MLVKNGGPDVPLDEAVLFPFDKWSMPLRYRLKHGLVSATNPYRPHERVLLSGDPQDPDGLGMHYYGTVIRIGDELRMWYGGDGDDGTVKGTRMCYAVSTDGINWEKPELGLVEFNGTRNNNLVQFDSEHSANMGSILVVHDPEDPDPDRRFKLVNEVHPFLNIAAFSPDGLHWRESEHNPVLKHNAVEPGGLMKYGGCFYLSGQGGNVGTKRALVTYISYDFDHWSDAVAVGLRKDIPPYPAKPGPHAGEQVHLGASYWNRGNVILGIYGQWHGESNDRGFISMDLGLVVSHDALYFDEPVPDFTLIHGYEILSTKRKDMVRAPKAEQGQGFENIGDETLIWYWGWEADFICVARWPRDRLGYFEVVADPKPDLLMPEDTHTMFWNRYKNLPIDQTDPHTVSCPIRIDSHATSIAVNADGISSDSFLSVEVLDEQCRPIERLSGDAAATIHEPGLRQTAVWTRGEAIDLADQTIRVKVTWLGKRPEDTHLYALYVNEN